MDNLNIVENILNKLTSFSTVSGSESSIFEAIQSYFEEECVTDNLKSIKVSAKGDADISFLLDAHIDQIGFVVTDITDSGFLKVGAVGGIDIRTLAATDVVITNEKGKFFGVVTSIPPHLSGKNNGEAAEVADILIDVGMTKQQAAEKISRGDFVSFNYKLDKLANDRIVGASLDNKAGAAVLIRVYQLLKESCPKADAIYLFSSQEEAGLRGAKAASFGVSADEAIVVDVSFATAPGVDRLHAGELGKGPMVCISPIIDKKVSDGLIETATKSGIAFQKEICSSTTGTNADVISLSGNGTRTGLVSVPLRNMHTFSETISLQDVELSACLIAEYIKGRVKSDD